MRTRWILGGATTAAAAAVAGAVLLASGGDPVAAAPGEQPAAATAEVQRGTLRQVVEVAGELGGGTATTVTGRGEGIVTWLPSAGIRVDRGEQVYRVDDSPVALLYGDLPLYRTLRTPQKPTDPPLSGNDVDLVAANLAALGYDVGTTEDATYGATLADAVGDWQEDRGLEATGALEATDVVVTAGPVRIGEVLAQVGADAAGDVLTLTTTERALVLAVPPQTAAGLEPGRRIRVTLADGRDVATRVSEIGGTLTEGDDGSPTVAVTLETARPRRLEHAPLGPVTAEVVTAQRNGATYVPITALLALSGGGYAVERPDHTLVPVELGMVTEGRVEVAGIEPGETVVVAP